MNRTIKIVFVCLFYCFTPIVTKAQRKPNADSLFLKAREEALNERWHEARKKCHELLSHYPDYYDATMLLGRTYAWELKTDSARITVSPLLNIEPDSYDVLTLLVDNEIWSEKYDDGIKFIDRALLYYPKDEDLLFKKANAYYQKKDFINAAQSVQDLLTVNPKHTQGIDLQKAVQSSHTTILYQKAETATSVGNWKEARKYCLQLLADDPDNLLVSLLLANIYAFENRFDSARYITTKLYRTNSDNYDLLGLMVNIELWSNNYKKGMTQVEKALVVYPDNDDFLYKKALIQHLQKDDTAALETLDHLLGNINPEHEDAIKLRNEILQSQIVYKDYVFLEEYFEYHDEPYNHKMITTAGLAKWTKYGTYIGKINMGQEWGQTAPMLSNYQLELEAYQNLLPSNSLWLNYAWSPSTFFPTHKGGIEFFQGLIKGFEASLGTRFLYWENEDPVFVYTAMISWMKKRNYFSIRAFLTSSDYTGILTYRRHFSPKPEYFYVLAGYGNYSDAFFQTQPFENISNSTWLCQIGIQKFITPRWFFLAAVGGHYAIDSYQFLMGQAGIRYHFNMVK